MKNDDQTTRSKRSRSFTQEMQQAFVDRMKKLPFINRDILKDPEWEDLEEESADQASAPHPTDGALAGGSLDNRGRHR
jgi:hypothetical protein